MEPRDPDMDRGFRNQPCTRQKSASDKRKAVAAAVVAAGALMASSAAQAGVDLGGSAVNITPMVLTTVLTETLVSTLL